MVWPPGRAGFIAAPPPGDHAPGTRPAPRCPAPLRPTVPATGHPPLYVYRRTGRAQTPGTRDPWVTRGPHPAQGAGPALPAVTQHPGPREAPRAGDGGAPTPIPAALAPLGVLPRPPPREQVS